VPSHDVGIRHDSFGYKWDISNPIMSDRDMKFCTLAEFQEFFE
jgi:hypothetical protein